MISNAQQTIILSRKCERHATISIDHFGSRSCVLPKIVPCDHDLRARFVFGAGETVGERIFH